MTYECEQCKKQRGQVYSFKNKQGQVRGYCDKCIEKKYKEEKKLSTVRH